jgi:hypothetical protein
VSNTQYSRTQTLRMDESERRALYFAVMQAIMVVSRRRLAAPPALSTRDDRVLLGQLRNLLDRLENMQ